jgi:hypothetical protein
MARTLDRVRANDVRPALGLGERSQVQQEARCNQFLILAAWIELGGLWRVAAESSLHHGGAGRLAKGDRGVDPLVAAERIEFVREHGHGRLFAAGRPPVDHFHVRSADGRRRQHGSGHRGHHRHKILHRVVLPTIT